MKTEYLMDIGYIFKEKGKRIVGGVPLQYAQKDLNWLDFVNRNILINGDVLR